MKRRTLMALVTVLLAAAAAGGVFLFMQSVRDRAESGPETVEVLVSTRDIPAGQDLDPLIEEGAFRTKEVAREDLVPGVITDVYQLRGQRTAYPIVAEEQIPAARLAGALQAQGGILGIPEGLHAASVALEPQRVVAGAIRQGDHVEVFGTFGTRAASGGSTTRVVIPDALVLAVELPEEGIGAGTNAIVTLAVSPVQASMLIYAQEQGTVWLTLLPPNEAGVEVPPVSSRTLQ